MFFYIKGTKIYPTKQPSVWARIVVLRPGVMYALNVLSVLLATAGLVVLVISILSILGLLKVDVTHSFDYNSRQVSLWFFVTFIAAYCLMRCAPRLARSRQAIKDGAQRERYVVETDFSYQMFFNCMPVVEQLTLIDISKMFANDAMVTADKQIRRLVLHDAYDLDAVRYERHKVLYLIQAMYVSNDLFNEEIAAAIGLQHKRVDQTAVHDAQLELRKTDSQRQSLMSLLARIESESTRA